MTKPSSVSYSIDEWERKMDDAPLYHCGQDVLERAQRFLELAAQRKPLPAAQISYVPMERTKSEAGGWLEWVLS